mmetsp:Transcript_30054/g.34577  ORF Transcript_30054/g.34577 Transcript_30054/m.34577 type:complete len:315 (-) Transcript_30054:409-1353(-)
MCPRQNTMRQRSNVFNDDYHNENDYMNATAHKLQFRRQSRGKVAPPSIIGHNNGRRMPQHQEHDTVNEQNDIRTVNEMSLSYQPHRQMTGKWKEHVKKSFKECHPLNEISKQVRSISERVLVTKVRRDQPHCNTKIHLDEVNAMKLDPLSVKGKSGREKMVHLAIENDQQWAKLQMRLRSIKYCTNFALAEVINSNLLTSMSPPEEQICSCDGRREMRQMSSSLISSKCMARRRSLPPAIMKNESIAVEPSSMRRFSLASTSLKNDAMILKPSPMRRLSLQSSCFESRSLKNILSESSTAKCLNLSPFSENFSS